MKVELEIKFNIGDKVKRYSNGEICIVKDIFVNVDERNIKHIHYHIVNEQNKTDLCLSGCSLEKARILDKQEHDYLRAVCKPFIKDIKKITKRDYGNYVGYIELIKFTTLTYTNENLFQLPLFDSSFMYKGMEVNRYYTIEDLELDKEWEE